MAEYSDPLVILVMRDLEMRQKLANLFEAHDKKTGRMVATGAFELDTWATVVENVRNRHEPYWEAIRLRTVARMILVGTHRTTTLRGTRVEMETVDAAIRMTEFVQGEEWKNAVETARAILQSEFVHLEHEVEA